MGKYFYALIAIGKKHSLETSYLLLFCFFCYFLSKLIWPHFCSSSNKIYYNRLSFTHKQHKMLGPNYVEVNCNPFIRNKDILFTPKSTQKDVLPTFFNWIFVLTSFVLFSSCFRTLRINAFTVALNFG